MNPTSTCRQESAWADTAVSVDFVERTLRPGIEAARRKEREEDDEQNDEFVLFVDNLGAQLTPQFKSAVKSIGGLPYYGIANATDDIWQPVAAGAGKMLKVLARQEQDTWLMSAGAQNYERWAGTHDGKMTVGDRRILITQVYILEHLLGQSSSSCESKDIKVCIICNFSG